MVGLIWIWVLHLPCQDVRPLLPDSNWPGQYQADKGTLQPRCTSRWVTLYKAVNLILRSVDCVNGTWFGPDFNGGRTNYSYLTRAYAEEREKSESRVKDIEGLDAIAYEPHITIYNFTK